MSDTHYKITMDGSLAPGVTLDFAQEGLARLFKKDVSVIKHLFSGKKITIKRDINASQADKYVEALFSAGVIAHKEVDLAANLSLEAISSDSPEQDSEQMICPKCATEQALHETCQHCGIVIAKFNSYQAQASNLTKAASVSPYASPTATIEQDTAEVGELSIWGVEGRIGRMRYIAWSMVFMFAMAPAMLISMLAFKASVLFGGLLMTVAGVAAMIIGIQISVKRLHDIGWSGWLLLISLIPVVGSIFQLLIFVLPGSQGNNRYGAPAPANSTAVKVLFWIWVALLSSGFVLGIISGMLGAMLGGQY
ncbi:DUF805 domain-containing protein [Pseudomonas sp. C27(2019)]|uniref:DUF805 domain-containing protein n=1 Tax=Pseudomonas sp. C27(2019) TaxID=2604941 RepID=UPI0012469066|nr:DUF805 domain-containing protein [Pseudomonas sp. C27(2019)]QEY59831.1 DUF805 domain-containing protein [Pseudomonas sp. C27(2019)]